MNDSTGSRFRLVVFDWDGTLADSTALIASAIQRACHDLGEPIPDPARARHVIGLGLADALAHVAPALPRERYAELAARYRYHYMIADAEIPLFAGVSEMLSELEERSVLLAIATGKSRAGLDRALEHQGIARHFVATRCADEGPPKPNPDMLLHLIDLVGAKPASTLMIGDTTHDLELARNAGVAALAVSYGAHDSSHFAPFAPLATLDSVAALRAWLRQNG